MRAMPIFLISFLGACVASPVMPPTAPKGAVPSPRAAPERIGLQPEPDTCGARSYTYLLGHPVAHAPQHPGNRNYRIATDDGPITADLNPQRVNIFYNEESGLIVGIKCG